MLLPASNSLNLWNLCNLWLVRSSALITVRFGLMNSDPAEFPVNRISGHCQFASGARDTAVAPTISFDDQISSTSLKTDSEC
jgi:hypothetical protein